jgi:perosamine synthetase
MINHIEPYYGIKEQKAMAKYLKSGGFMTEHGVTEEFEKMLAKFLGVPYVSCVPSGTIAIYLSLLAAGIGKGDKVLVPDLTMIATANAVRMTGAEPILVDIDAFNFCLDLTQIQDEAKAMIYVDLNGRSGNMKEVKKYCKDHGLILIEDACQSLGSKYKGKYLGTFGRFGCFSLGFHKIITTGQGGFIVTHTKEDYESIERLKDFGRVKGGNDIHDYMGFNFKFTDLQAVIGIEQLKTIEWRMKKKRQLYKWYFDEEAEEGYVPWFIEYIGFDRDEVYKKLMSKQIGCRKMYPPIHSQKIYTNGDFSNAENISEMVLWLPSSLSLTKKQVQLIRREYEGF